MTPWLVLLVVVVNSFYLVITNQVVKPQLDLQTHKIYKGMKKRLGLKVNYSINVEIINE